MKKLLASLTIAILAPLSFSVPSNALPEFAEPAAINLPERRDPVPGDCGSYFHIAIDAGFTIIDWFEVAAIGDGESGCGLHKENIGCTWYTINGKRKRICEHSLGWGQINVRGTLFTNPIGYGESQSLKELCGLETREDLLDDVTNINCMYKFEMVFRNWDGRLWGPWGGPGRH